MSKTHSVSISCEGYGLAGNLVLPDGATAESPVPGAVIIGGPGPLPLTRYSETGARQWPVLWSESLANSGLAALCYDQRGGGLSSGTYHEADWTDLLEDNRAAVEMLALQPEVGPVAAVAWAEGCGFALQLAAEGKVQALILLAPPYHNAETRYARDIAALAARKGLSDRVVQLRINQWQSEIRATLEQVQKGQTVSTTDVGGQVTSINLIRFLQTTAFDPSRVAAQVKVPVLLLHGRDDTAIPPVESEAMAAGLNGQTDRVVYPGMAHFIYRHGPAMRDAAAWLRRTLC